MKIGGTVVGQNYTPVPKVQVRIRIDVPAASAVDIQAWDELVQTRHDGSWAADFIPANAEKLTSAFYHEFGPPEAATLSRDDPGFEEFEKTDGHVPIAASRQIR